MINKNKDWKAFVRGTSNTMSTTNHYQINLPPHIIKKMGWKLNEKVRIKTVKGKFAENIQNYILIEKDIDD